MDPAPILKSNSKVATQKFRYVIAVSELIPSFPRNKTKSDDHISNTISIVNILFAYRTINSNVEDCIIDDVISHGVCKFS